MKKLIGTFAFATLTAMILVGCGDEPNDANQKIEPGQAQAPSAPQGAAAGTTGGGESSGPKANATTEVQLD